MGERSGGCRAAGGLHVDKVSVALIDVRWICTASRACTKLSNMGHGVLTTLHAPFVCSLMAAAGTDVRNPSRPDHLPQDVSRAKVAWTGCWQPSHCTELPIQYTQSHAPEGRQRGALRLPRRGPRSGCSRLQQGVQGDARGGRGHSSRALSTPLLPEGELGGGGCRGGWQAQHGGSCGGGWGRVHRRKGQLQLRHLLPPRGGLLVPKARKHPRPATAHRLSPGGGRSVVYVPGLLGVAITCKSC